MNLRRILEIKHTLDQREQHFYCELLDIDNDHAVVKHELKEERQLHSVQLPERTITFGYFWRQRPYNLYHFMAPTRDGQFGETLAYYFNISDQTDIHRDCIKWRDLMIDILVEPMRQPIVLDENQLPDSVDINLMNYINDAKEYVVEHYQTLSAEAERNTSFWQTKIKLNN